MTQPRVDGDKSAVTCPVRDFNYTDYKPAGTWFGIYDKFAEESPIYRNEFGPGFFTAVTYEGILEILQHPETFSNSVVTPLDPDPQVKWIPEMLDGAEHAQWRRQLAPLFAPKTTEKLEEKMRHRAGELIDDILAKNTGKCDLIADFAQRFPTTIFLELMGLPVDELDQFTEWEDAIMHSTIADMEERNRVAGATMMAVMGRFSTIIAERRVTPQDDIISKALEFRIDGEPVSDADLLSFCLLMFMAGLDTVSVTLGWSFYHLANHPEDRAEIIVNPDLIPSAVEEFLRAFAIIVPARKVVTDTVVQGCPMKAGDMINFPLSAANRDEAAFHEAAKVDIYRTGNNHVAFGAGPHRCLGSHLARRELRIALEEWHKRIPNYRITPGTELVETGAQIGLTSLPLEWDPA
ncbi:cytochrome P450 [Nocardia sp. NPDC005366]|uniref:cytochrome P450 n=1 Tax=Nocardia sp. NPDC005366 TaxID=3156878 RepID=UPI0033A25E61